MTFKVFAPETKELKPRIVVFGVGGAGGNAVNNMIEAGLEGVEFVVANTDAQQLAFSKTEKRVQLGVQVTQGLGAGAHPEVGMSAAEESTSEIGEHLDGAHMVFITAGMGGGTGTGAGPIIAKCARERGILTVGVVTKPFHFEGRHRMRLADAGIAELQRYVDTLIVIPNQNLFRVANERTTFAEAFAMADQVLHSGVRSITDLMVLPGLINLDFADVRTVMTEMGKAMMGTGEATGEGRALMAAENAIQNPLLDEVTLKGAKAVLVNITGGLDMTLLEVDEAANAISNQVDPEANIIFGAAFDPSLANTLRVSVVATGMDGMSISAIEPAPRRTTRRGEQPQAYTPAPMPEPYVAPVPPMPEPVRQPEPVLAFEPAPTPEPIAAYVREPEAAPVAAQAPEAAPQVTTFEARPAATPRIVETEIRREEPVVAAAPEPTIIQPQARPVARIVDPSVADEDESGPLFPESPGYGEERRQKGGWLSIFGRPRHDQAPPAPARSHGASQPHAHAAPEAADDPDDLEIPSFLRRLAN
ncbi:MAG TPA: cell division protein FtsZ [Caulobacteraceae bacterium]|nr:cell division protein FtsZ [Caulobacteraceae bacterium]